MKTKKWQALVAVAFAWVLWQHSYSTYDSLQSWGYVGGYEKRENCISAIKKQVANIKKKNPKARTVIAISSTVEIVSYGPLKGQAHLYCVPSQNVSLRELINESYSGNLTKEGRKLMKPLPWQ